MLERPRGVLVFYPISIRVTCLNSAKPPSRVNRGGQRYPAIIREIHRSRRNEIFTWNTRWLQHARQKDTTNHRPCNRKAFIVYIILPTIALLALRLDVQQERQSRPSQTRVPALKGLSYENAETKLHASNLYIQLLATRYDLSLQPGLIIDQTPQPGEEVNYGYSVGVTITKADSHGPGR